MSGQHARARASAWTVAIVTAAVSFAIAALPRARPSSSSWPGVDESVIQHFARAAGRGAPSFSLDFVRGDLLLFAFLCAGLMAGFVLGFFGRALFVEQRERKRGERE